MRIVCPFTPAGRHPATERALSALGARFCDVSASDSAYWHLLRQLWEQGQPFIIVEHDLEPRKEQLQALWDCPEPLCTYRYLYRGQAPVHSLGCTKFSRSILEREMEWRFRWSVLAYDEAPHWRDVCSYLLSQLPNPHLHEGLIPHHDEGR